MKELNSRYKNFKTVEDLASIADYDLLTASNRMGLISDHVFEVFKFINYMRNHSSAAHPNENNISAFDLLSWLSNCIKYAINTTPNADAIKLQQLLYNIRTSEIPESDLQYIGENIKNLPQVMVDDLQSALFGMYIDPTIKQSIAINIKSIAKYVWDLSSESQKHTIGDKYGYYRKNGDIARKDKSNEYLTLVDGQSYKDEDSISQELREILANLMSTHNNDNNFYNEAPWAKQLSIMIPENGKIPSSILQDWVKTISICYAGNGLGYREGVDEGALPYYKAFIKNFDNASIVCLVNMMDDSSLLYDIDMPKTTRRFKTMCKFLSTNCTNDFLKSTLDYIATCNEPLSNVHKTTAYKDLLKKVNIQF